MKAAAPYAKAKEAMGFALRSIRPALLLREIQAISMFYSPGRTLSVLLEYYSDDLKAEYYARRTANRAYQGAIEQRIYAWIEQNARLHADHLYQYYLNNKHWMESYT